jgi:mono/diheme cytochrome c family protein
MTANIITVLAVVAGIVWLGVLFVSAIRNKGGEEVPRNLRPGINDEVLETRRLENGQKFAIAMSAFLAVSLPLYFLGEPARQEGFVEEFATASEERGAHIVEEFACFSCHGPEGVGGVASYVEKRSGVTVAWAAPSLNDVLFRYDPDELNFWVTFGRGNTPMPPWGLPGGGPLNEAQVEDVVNYLKTIQISQDEALAKVEPATNVELDRLANADASVANTILNQEQIVAQISQASADAPIATDLAERGIEILEGASEGIDTDADGLSDVSEQELSALSTEAVEAFTVVDAIVMDPAVADAEKAGEAVAQLEAGIETDPILKTNLAAVEMAISGGGVDPALGLSENALAELESIREDAAGLGVSAPESISDLNDATALLAALDEAATADPAVDGAQDLATDAAAIVLAGSDPDGDGLSSGSELVVTNQMADANNKTIPSQVVEIALDPTNPESVAGVPDLRTAERFVGNLSSLETTLTVTSENQTALFLQEQGGLDYLEQSSVEAKWEIDFAGVADSMGVDENTAERAVALFNASCARCHTAGYTAGVAFSEEAGSGSFGPALWEGRPVVQFGESTADPADDLLVGFLIRGSEPEKPYGINGFGSGRMPAFGATLTQADIELLAMYLRGGNMDGME